MRVLRAEGDEVIEGDINADGVIIIGGKEFTEVDRFGSVVDDLRVFGGDSLGGVVPAGEELVDGCVFWSIVSCYITLVTVWTGLSHLHQEL